MTSCWKVLQEKKDSLSSRFYDFAATKEVIQANHFKNDNRLNDLVENPNRTYIKSPAGIFTEAIFPIAEIYSEHKNDTLNGVNVSLPVITKRSPNIQ